MSILGAVLNDLWWGFTAYVCFIQIHNGLIHIGNMIGGSAKLVVDAAHVAKKGQ